MLTIIPSAKPRIHVLDALRGLAALSVVICHITNGFNGSKLLLVPFLNITVAAHGAVVFFFVLSGYVLVYQYAGNVSYTYGRFLVQRIFRIYIPYLAALLITFVLFSLGSHNHTENTFLGQLWLQSLNAKLVVKHIILIGNFNTNAFIPPIWSLVHEMRVAFIFPLLLLLLRLKAYQVIMVMVLILGVAALAIAFNTEQTFGYLNSYTHTLYYFSLFVAGGLIAKNQHKLTGRYGMLNTVWKVVLLVTALLIYNYANVIFSVIAPSSISVQQLATGAAVTEDVLVTITSCWFIIVAISFADKQSVLGSKLPVFLGKISYSLYLVHAPVAGFIYFSLYNKLPLTLILCLCFGVVIFVAAIFNKYVEQPAVKLAKRIIARMVKKQALS